MSLEMHMETGRLNELRESLGGRDRASLEMHLGTERSCELRDALGDSD